jgi:hypothetical protein
MRTKTLLVIAALTATGAATSMAQVFSVNAVGYVVKTIPAKGLALISNPLKAQNNSIAELFKGAPAGTTVYKFDPAKGKFDITSMDDIDNAFLPADVAAKTVVPGEGVFVLNTTASPLSFTFVGEVEQGTLVNPLPAGLSIKSSMVPQKGTPKDLGLVGEPGDIVYQFNPATQAYSTPSVFDDIDNAWLPALKDLEVGDAFFLRKAKAGTWTRTFNVNTP